MATVKLTRAELAAGDITKAVLASNPGIDADALATYHQFGLFKFEAIPDEDYSFRDLCGDCYNAAANPDIPPARLEKERKAFRSRVDRQGVWGVKIRVRLNRGKDWDCAQVPGMDSIWGFVGDDFIGSGYEPQLMQEALEWLRSETKCGSTEPTLATHMAAAKALHALDNWDAATWAEAISDASTLLRAAVGDKGAPTV